MDGRRRLVLDTLIETRVNPSASWPPSQRLAPPGFENPQLPPTKGGIDGWSTLADGRGKIQHPSSPLGTHRGVHSISVSPPSNASRPLAAPLLRPNQRASRDPHAAPRFPDVDKPHDPQASIAHGTVNKLTCVPRSSISSNRRLFFFSSSTAQHPVPPFPRPLTALTLSVAC